jgi:MFS family permease
MTTDASVATTDTKPAYPRQPRTIRLALLAAVATAMLAGPVTMTLFVAGQAAQGMPLFGFTDVADMIATISVAVMYSTLLGLMGSGPAAIINTLILAYLARRRRDASGLAIGSGLILGFVVGVTLPTIMALLNEGFLDDTGPGYLEFAASVGLPLLIAGGLMGALHWWIAIRPRRRWRLFQERERAALLAME